MWRKGKIVEAHWGIFYLKKQGDEGQTEREWEIAVK